MHTYISIIQCAYNKYITFSEILLCMSSMRKEIMLVNSMGIWFLESNQASSPNY